MKRFLSAVMVAASPHIFANDVPMEHVLVSVPLHKKMAETALPITVLSGDELRRQANATIGETLSGSPGLASASFGPGVGQPVIRGQSGPRVKVLQNGTSSADASNVSADHATSVEPLLADSIEVLRGPATLLYGGGAIGGVVNVLDNRIPTAPLESLQGGVEYRRNSASSADNIVGRLEGGDGSFAFHLDGLWRNWGDLDVAASGRGQRAILANSDGQTSAYTAGASYHIDKGFVGLSVNRLDNEYGVPTGLKQRDKSINATAGQHAELESIRIDVEQTRYDAALHLHHLSPAIEVLRGFFTYTDYQHQELEGIEVGTRYRNDSWETRLEVVHEPYGNAHGSFGLQASGSKFSALGEEAFIPPTESSEWGLYWVEDFHYQRLTLELGARLDWAEREPDSMRADKTDFSAQSFALSSMIELSDQWHLGVALMRAQRAPAIEELYSNIGGATSEDWLVHAASRSIELGDQNLEKETSTNTDISLSWSVDEHFVTINAFYNDFSNYISLTSTGIELDEVAVYQYANDDARFYGVELDSEFAIASVFGGSLGLKLTGDVIRGKLDNGADVPRLPPSRLGSKLSWTDDNWYAYASVLRAAEQSRPGALEKATNGYTRWDAGVEYSRGVAASSTLVIFAKVTNIGDDDIRLSTSFLRDIAPESGRSLEAGFRLEL